MEYLNILAEPKAPNLPVAPPQRMGLVIAIDLSTKPGVAVFLDGNLCRYGTLFKTDEMGAYPYGWIEFLDSVTQHLFQDIKELESIYGVGSASIVLEETTASSQNYSQKKLEWMHLKFLMLLRNHNSIAYIRDGTWKTLTGARARDEDAKLNAKIRYYKKKHGTKLAKLDLDGSGKAKVVGKKTKKHYALRAATELFDLDLMRKDEDAADAVLLGLAFLMGAPLCDGSQFGGLLKRAKETKLKDQSPV